MKHSHIIRHPRGEPRIGSREPVRGTFANRFVEIRITIRRNKRTGETEEEP